MQFHPRCLSKLTTIAIIRDRSTISYCSFASITPPIKKEVFNCFERCYRKDATITMLFLQNRPGNFHETIIQFSCFFRVVRPFLFLAFFRE